MPGFSTYDDLITEITTNGKALRWDFVKSFASPQGAGSWLSFWKQAGTPAAGADPATTPGAAHTNLAGSMNWSDTSTDIKTLLSFGAAIQSVNSSGTLMIYDRLVGVGGIALSSTGSKTVSSAALPRYTSGQNVQAWLEVTTATTVTAPVVHLLSYTGDTLGAGQVGGSFTFPAAATVVGTMLGPLPIAAGDGGITAVSTLNVDTAGTAGVANLLLIRPLAYLPGVTQLWNERDFLLQLAAMPRIFDGASIGLAWLATNSNAVTLSGQVSLGYG